MEDEEQPLLRVSMRGEARIAMPSAQSSTNRLVKAEVTAPKRTRNALGTLNGVYVPCSLTIMSAVLFLRLGWATGVAGFLETVAMLLIGEAMTSLTALSLSAIVTNGDMRGGGSYFMIRCGGGMKRD